ncbi:hypothetical protein [Chryseobacterium indologenes]|uniref:hypothetical protein n=1 Tax=Chryseobacterium indologenes TaxID=253 RepID=UPI000647FC47|nr:hypothetical protein [Chryseobacterium indologenes]
MFNISRLRVEILTNKSESIEDLFGFDFNFRKGLNIIAGHNSRGKTTINSCIYYAIGLEELLGGHNEKALDKALKDNFTIQEEDYKVRHSKVFLEIKNSQQQTVTLLRYIIPESDGKKTSNIEIYNGSLENIKELEESILFINGRGNNEDENSFYPWFASFIGIEIPLVSNSSKTSNYSPLYLQTIFSALFVEQTKGWADFLSTIPYFGIPDNKQKVIEFLLGLNELGLATKKDILNKEKNELTNNWQKNLRSLTLVEKQYNGTLRGIPEEITTDKGKIEKIQLFFTVSEEESQTLEEKLTAKEKELADQDQNVIPTIQEAREETIEEYNKNKDEYDKLRSNVREFEKRLGLEKLQLENLKKQEYSVENEIKEHLNLKKVFDENIINKGENHCPTCSQEVSSDLLSTKDFKIPILSVEQNIAFLRSQRELIKVSTHSLKKTTEEKNVILTYYKNILRKREVMIKSLSRDLIADDRAFSEATVLKRLQIENEIESLNFIKTSLKEVKESLIELANKLNNILNEIDKLKNYETEDEKILVSFQKFYQDLLKDFKYDSNQIWQITINRSSPFKYFPTYRPFKDALPQSIRTNSSASDFIRNLWAYTLALAGGVNHPGIVIFDEPGQHRTNMQSIKALFLQSSLFTNHQVIIFTSVDKQINENEKLELDDLVSDLEEGTYHLISLDEDNKVIGKLANS